MHSLSFATFSTSKWTEYPLKRRTLLPLTPRKKMVNWTRVHETPDAKKASPPVETQCLSHHPHLIMLCHKTRFHRLVPNSRPCPHFCFLSTPTLVMQAPLSLRPCHTPTHPYLPLPPSYLRFPPQLAHRKTKALHIAARCLPRTPYILPRPRRLKSKPQRRPKKPQLLPLTPSTPLKPTRNLFPAPHSMHQRRYSTRPERLHLQPLCQHQAIPR